MSWSARWRLQAVCTGEESDLFFPVGTIGPALAQIERARQICRACPVRIQCLEWAFDHHADYGIWGGLSEDERRSLRRTRHPAIAPRAPQTSDRGLVIR